MSTDPRPEASEAIRARRATVKGPWQAASYGPYPLTVRVYGPTDPPTLAVLYRAEDSISAPSREIETQADRDADFIAHAPTDIDTLLAELDALRQQLAEAKKENIRLKHDAENAQDWSIEYRKQLAEAEAERARLKDSIQRMAAIYRDGRGTSGGTGIADELAALLAAHPEPPVVK